MNGKSVMYNCGDLLSFAASLLENAGLAQDRARIVAQYLVEADLMGHSTHGLNLLPSYLKELEDGTMTITGEPDVITDKGASMLWDGSYLPGIWLTKKALDEACLRISEHAVVTCVIRRSHHIGALAVYLPEIAEKGLFCLISCSDPNAQFVAPFGGKEPLYSPNPIAAGFSAGKGGPIIMDISASVTAKGVVSQYQKEKKRLPGRWLLDADGNPTDDPDVLSGNPHGTILPLGGLEFGYKGFALGLLIEAMTSALGGYGRSREPGRWSGSVFIQVIDPDAFGGREAFEREMEWLAEGSRASTPRLGTDAVRVPGDRALALRKNRLEHGVDLDRSILEPLAPWAVKLNVKTPREKTGRESPEHTG